MFENDFLDFELNGVEECTTGSLLDESTEGEFAYKCASNHPEEHFDSDNSGNHEIPVPGGDNEKPSAKPADGEFGPTPPGGNSETPSFKLGEFGPSLNNGNVTLKADAYNDAVSRLKQSFKECYEALDSICEK